MTSFDPHDTSTAMAQLDRVKTLLSSSGVRFANLNEVFGGVGIAVAWGETEYVVLTVMVGAEEALWVSSGILKDVAHERLPALEACNLWNQTHAGYPCYLHDADSGWDVLMQQHYPLQLALDVPPFFKAWSLEGMPRSATDARGEESFSSLEGSPYGWNEEDSHRLLMRSMF